MAQRLCAAHRCAAAQLFAGLTRPANPLCREGRAYASPRYGHRAKWEDGRGHFSEDDGHQLRLADEEIASFAARFNALKAARHFHLLSFEALVKNLHTIVAERLWRLVMVEAQLVEHLRAVRDLVLMGHGALWHELIVQGRDLMRHPPKRRTAR